MGVSLDRRKAELTVDADSLILFGLYGTIPMSQDSSFCTDDDLFSVHNHII
jgi:hypothetical protein